MKFLKLSLLALVLFAATSCFDDMDDTISSSTTNVKDFVWKGMNFWYLYKSEIPDLADNRFSSNEEYSNYLNSFLTPEELFESLIYQRETVDRFSAIVDDYIALEQSFDGTSYSNGLKYTLYEFPENSSNVIGIIKMVLNDSEASAAGVQRGQIFNSVDGTVLNIDNYGQLLNQQSYTLGFVDYNDNGTPENEDDFVESNGQTTSLTKVVYNENPVYISSILEVNGENVGYLMYNRFNNNYDSHLNNAFAEFQASNVQHVIMDFRYNPGGSVNTASLLGSMVTGQFTGENFSKLIYNSDLQSQNSTYEFKDSFNGIGINHLNLSKVYIITSARTASASELVINSLNPYIDVVVVGDETVGKSQASITVYDSPNFTAQNRNPTHTYALQPLVAQSINSLDEAVPSSGLVPEIEVIESALNLGVLGDVNEPLLAAALADIQGSSGRFAPSIEKPFLKPIDSDLDKNPFEDFMYLDDDHSPFK
ncbi:S41 family peptidase [Mangrovimonas sp. TPBH4]|uniref:S41 family peptidase n=1 Tax=Mangrovimonas sp. TPBH4 TaxID=1645914 RepID=UPI0009EB9B22|nr:S41 family peptidase [Mangrovimonas sp. TPBH4]